MATSPREVVAALRETREEDRRLMGQRARTRVLAEHTYGHRAEQLENYVREAERA